MPGNLIAFLLCCLLAWLLYHFRLRKAASRAEVRRLLPIYLVLAAFLAFNALLAWQGRAAFRQAIEETPVTTQEKLEQAGTGAGIILDGTVERSVYLAGPNSGVTILEPGECLTARFDLRVDLEENG